MHWYRAVIIAVGLAVIGPAIASAETWILWEGRGGVLKGPPRSTPVGTASSQAECMAKGRTLLTEYQQRALPDEKTILIHPEGENRISGIDKLVQCWPQGVNPQ